VSLPATAAGGSGIALDGPPKRLYIDGEWTIPQAGGTIPSINPSTGEQIAEIAAGDVSDIDLAVAAARRAFDGPWSRFTPAQREGVLLRLADLVDGDLPHLARLDAVDMGAPIGRPANTFAGQTLRYYAGWATKLHGETIPTSFPRRVFGYTRREPVGVVGAIIPWNGPLNAVIWKLAPALAVGCTMVLKPAEDASLTPLRMAELIEQLDLPPGVFNVVTGTGAAAGTALAAHPDVDKIAFTGSTATAQAIIRAGTGNLKRASLELGGKSADIVFADADFDAAVSGAAMGVFNNTGQVCCAGTRIYVERPIYADFVDALGEAAGRLRVGNSLDPTTQIGPLVSARQLDRVNGYVEAGVAEGARRVAGGKRVEAGDLARGYFLEPTVFADVGDQMMIAREEIFGPVASVMPFDDLSEVVARANSSRYGLGGGVWTRDIAKGHYVAESIRTGVMWVNMYGAFDPAMPFGGVKMSGWGNELSGHALEEYTNIKAVWICTELPS
jgi:aldehyde dehydrogenase (NAD+)